MLDRGRVWRPLDAQTDPAGGGRSATSARPLVPRYLRRGVDERLLADGSVLSPLDEEQARAPARGAARCNVEGVAICLINAYVNAAHERRLRSSTHEVLGRRPGLDLVGDLAAGQGVRARVDDRDRRVHEADLHRATRDELDRELRELGLHRRAQLRRLRRDAAALARRRSSSRSGSCSPARPRARCRAARSARRSATRNLICCDVGGTSTDISLVVDGQPFVNNTFELEHDLIINALSTRDLERRRGRRQHRLDLAVRATSWSGPAAPAPIPGRPATAAAATRRR